MNAPLLTAHGITGGYGKLDILHEVSLGVHAGEIVSVIGPNGAGKSTAFKTIVGFLRPRSGRPRGTMFCGSSAAGHGSAPYREGRQVGHRGQGTSL